MAIKIFLGGIKWHFLCLQWTALERQVSLCCTRHPAEAQGGDWLKTVLCALWHCAWQSLFVIMGYHILQKGGRLFLEKSHACDLLSSLLLLALLCCSLVKRQNTLSKVECQYIGHCSNTKSKQHLLHWRACDQNSQDKAWKHREYLKSKVISFSFVLSKCSCSLATQIFNPTSLNNLIFWESWNYHVLTSKERPSLSFSNHNHLKWATELSSEHSASEASLFPWSHNVLVILTRNTGNSHILVRHLHITE